MPKDFDDQLLEHIKTMHKRLERLENNAAPTIPTYDSTNFPEDAVPGQIAKDHAHVMWVYGEDNAWHQVGAAAAYRPWAYAGCLNQTHPGGSSVTHVPNLTGFVTNSSADFLLGTDSQGRGKQTIKFRTFGSYKVWIAAQFTGGGTVGNKYTAYWDNAIIPSGFQAGSPDYIYKASFTNITDFTELGKLASGDVPMPYGGSPWVKTYAAGGVTYYLQMYVEKIDDAVYLT